MRRTVVNDSPTGPKTSLVKASVRRLDPSLEQLEALHKSSGTSSHLRVPNKKRIKLLHDHPSDGVQAASRTMKKVPKLGTGFPFLEGDGVAGGTCPMELSDSDEFPEPHELVQASIRNAGETDRRLVSWASDYSDPDVDALIRGAHLDDIPSTGIDTANNQDISASGSIQRTLECKGRKEEGHAVYMTARTGATACTGTVSPRLQLQVGLQLKFSLQLTKEQSGIETRFRLFHSGSDSEPDAPNLITTTNDRSAHKENFVLDETLFDVLGSEATKDPPVAPPLSRSSSPAKTQHLSITDSEEPSFYAAWKNEQRKRHGDDWNPVAVPARPPAEPEYNHLADFEDWLATTNSIEFID